MSVKVHSVYNTMCTKLHIFTWKKILSVEKFYIDAVGGMGNVHILFISIILEAKTVILAFSISLAIGC